ncbi:MAG TPA: PQQ-dependent sugar dehydrogenase [Actinopolymorphaceae bacterium]
MRRRAVAVVLGIVVLGTSAACGGPEDPATKRSPRSPSATTSPAATSNPPAPPSPTSSGSRPTTTVTPSPSPSRREDPRAIRPAVSSTVTTGLTSPWDVAVLPDGSALVSERDTGRIVRVTTSGTARTIGRVPGVDHGGEGGLLGLALSPRYPTDHLMYAYITTSGDNRVVTMTYDEGRLGRPRVVLDGIPRGDLHHNGGRIRFGPDGFLYVSTGDGGVPSRAQDKESLAGKILRITTTGRPASGNPFGNEVWTYGHRNVEGLAFDDEGRLWASEFGDKGADELNLIRRGGNYGWPHLEGRGGTDQGFVDPVATWDIEQSSPAGIAYRNGAIWMAALRGQRLWRVRLDGTEVVARPTDFLVEKYGRLRTVEAMPDGSLWLVTNNTDGRIGPRPGDDRILRLTLRR